MQPNGKQLSGSSTYTGSTTVSGGTLNGPISSLEKKEVAAPQEAMDSRARKDDGEKAAADDFGQMSTLSSLSGDKGSGKGFGNGAGTPESDMGRLGRDKGIAGGRTGSDFISPVDGTTVDGIPADPHQFTSNGVTNGLRSGDQAITRTNIDAILNNPNRTAESAAGERAALLKDGDSSGDLGVYYNKENKGMKDAPVAAPPVLAAKKPAPSENTPLPATAPAPGSFSDSLYSDADMLKSGAEAQRELESADLAFRAARGSAVEGLDRSKSDQSDENGKDIPVLGALFKQRQALNEEVVAGDPKNAAASDSTRAELMKSVEAAWALPVPFPATGGFQRDLSFRYNSRNGDKESSLNEWDELHRKPDVDFDGVINYGEPIRNTPVPALVDLMEEIPASENPYSTFSLNINDASFQTAKAALEKGERPDPESIKPEQFYNAVDYGDPAPTADQAVAATIEQSAHPVSPGRSLVRVALRVGATGHSKAQPLRLTLLVDQSGSMVREDRRAAMEQALAQLGGLLTKDDVISVVGFSRLPRLLADGMTGDQAGKLGDLVNQTASEGGTNLEEAMKVGEQLALRHQVAGAQNRIVLFTDGAANLGNADPEKLAAEVKVLRQKGIAFDIAGIGADGLNDRLLGELARHGNGRYYVVSDTKDAHFAQQLAGAFRPAAENVKVQVNFNPQRVGKYKLLGFEKDRLKTEDFRNDAVDAAELAAEEAGVAIYQVETLPEGTGEIGEVSVRFRDAASGDMVERSWTIPNESSVSAFDRATPSMQLAGLSLLAAEKLRGGPLGDAIDFNQFAGPRALVKQVYGCSTRVADMLRVIDALK